MSRKIAMDENTRSKIQTTLLVKRLTDHAMGDVELSSTQVNAIKILINKTLPDLQAVQMDLDVKGELGVRTITVKGVNPTDS